MAEKIFKNERDRSDFFIALVVLALFGSLLFGKRFFDKTSEDQKMALVTEEFDLDGDGILNEDDDCPSQYGTNVNGCPLDSDNDGVYNYMDQCPDTEGKVENYGCPVGVATKATNARMNENSRFTPVTPTVLGTGMAATNTGACSDACKEKTAAKILECQKDCLDDEACKKACETKIKAECRARCAHQHNGERACEPGCEKPCCANRQVVETTPVVVAPVITSEQIDSDRDGVVDSKDNCPEIAGPIDNFGCPKRETYEISEEDSKVLSEAIRDVQFETARAVLTPNSKIVLNRVADLMNKYSDARLEINGHTDNEGDAENNLDLSKRRAASCKQYLIEKGIDADRIVTNGYGQTKPIESNDTANGKRKNRRVEFNLFQ